MSRDIILEAADLWSKWGFDDGNLLQCSDEAMQIVRCHAGVKHRDVLVELVRRHLLPEIMQRSDATRLIDIVEIVSHHSPVRAADYWSGNRLEPPAEMAAIAVRVTLPQVAEASHAIWKRAQAARSSARI